MLHLLLLIWTSLVAAAATAELKDVRVFTSDGHARLLLVLTEAPSSVSARMVQSTRARPAHAQVLLEGVGVGADGDREIAVVDPAISGLTLRARGDDAEVVVGLLAERAVTTRQLGPTAVLIDLREEGRGEDPSLPSAEQLAAWLDATGLGRAAPKPRPRGSRLVVVDAGHGGWDHGAVGTTGTREADIALQIALRTATALRARGIDVVLTRDTDTFVELRDRAALANAQDADLFLSVHANAAPGPTAWGIETYSFDSASDAGAARVARRENTILREQRSEDQRRDPLLARMLVAGTNVLSRRLSREVQAAAVEGLRGAYGEEQIRDLGAKTALFYVLVSTRMPAILFESGFVSNPDDERRLRTPHYQQVLADALSDAVVRWFDSADARHRSEASP